METLTNLSALLMNKAMTLWEIKNVLLNNGYTSDMDFTLNWNEIVEDGHITIYDGKEVYMAEIERSYGKVYCDSKHREYILYKSPSNKFIITDIV